MTITFARIVLVLCFISPLSACGGGGGDQDFLPVTVKVEALVPKAAFPVSLAQAPDGRIFYTELTTGNIRLIENSSLNPIPVASVDILGSGDEGLLGLAIDPQFLSNGFIYTYYTARNPSRNVVARWAVVGNIASSPTIILDNLPFGGHNGGRLVFAADESLFISVGDAGSPALAQIPTSFAGKILRIQRDGSIPTDNPDARSPIFASGIRNAFGLAVDPRSGVLYGSDNGPACDDELNRIEADSNLGWREQQPCGDVSPNYTQPLIRFNPPNAPTGITFYSGSLFPELEGNLLLADYLSGSVTRFRLDAKSGQIQNSQIIINGQLGPLIDVMTGFDGYLYLATPTAIYRVTP